MAELEPFDVETEMRSLLNDMSERDLLTFAELHEDSASDSEIELYIYTCFLIFTRSGSIENLERAIQQAEVWIAVTSYDHPDRARRLCILDMTSAWMSQNRMTQEEAMAGTLGFRRAIGQESAVGEIDADVIAEIDNISGQAVMLLGTYEQTRSLHYLNEAIRIMEQILDMAGIHSQCNWLSNLGVMLGSRYERTGAIDDLNRAVAAATDAVDATPQDHPDRAGYLTNLGASLSTRFERTGLMDDLNRAVDAATDAANATPRGHSDRASFLNNLGASLSIRFERTGSVDDLNRAVDAATNAVDATPQGHSDRAAYLNNLGNSLGRRFEQTGSIDDLNRAVDAAADAVDTTPQDHPDRAGRLNNLGNWLSKRFERTDSMDDLNRAVNTATDAIDATPQDHPDRAAYLNNLGNSLGKRFERTGSVDDLNRAVNVTTNAVDATPWDHPNRAVYLSNLGTNLGIRFERTGSIDDLNRAVDAAIDAVDTTPQDHPDRAAYLDNLGNSLGRRFERTGSIDDSNRAVDAATNAVNATPQDHPDRAAYLNNLGASLNTRFKRTDLIDDLNRAINAVTNAVDATPWGHPNRAVYLNNLGNRLGRRFERTGSIDDLNRAVDAATNAVDAIPQDDPDRAVYLSNLGKCLDKRFERTGSIDDLNRALSSHKEGWRCSTAPPSIRMFRAQSAASILSFRRNWDESSQLLQEAVKLLPTVSPRLLKHTDKQHMLGDFAGLASTAASIALNAGKDAYHALQALELGRGVIASALMDMRGDVSDLKRKYPNLAEDFMLLRDELDSPTDGLISPSAIDGASSWESRAKRRREVDQKFSELITKIRAQPGFQNFLLPPTAEEIMAVSDPDPIVVVNSSPYRCDAFLIQRNRIKVLELPDLNLKEVQKWANNLRLSRLTAGFDLASLLEWLWNSVCRPCLDALGFSIPISDGNWPRVWWIPTGLLSQLPLHAAGRYAQQSTETVLDRVMSSYAPSIKALQHGRQTSAKSQTDSAVLVAMRKTPGLLSNGILPFAADEVRMLKNLCPELLLDPITPQLRKDDVLKHLQRCKIFHFAGHGRLDAAEPSQSSLLLEDWKTNPLTVGAIRDSKLQENPPFLAYLSACSTGTNDAARLADEGIHLVSAFQLAGFRHVVGTLWEVSDKHCVDVARVLYETLRKEGMSDLAVCRGLHQAVRALRDGGASKDREARTVKLVDSETQAKGLENAYWVPYIHFGV